MRVIYLWAAILAILEVPAMAATPDAAWDDRDPEAFLEFQATVEILRETPIVTDQSPLSTHQESFLVAHGLTPQLGSVTPSSLLTANALIRIDRRHSDVL